MNLPPLPSPPVRNRPDSSRTRRCASWPRRGTTSRKRSETRWYLAGPYVPSRKVLGKAGRLDGRGFFFKVNLPRARLGQELLLEPPAQPGFAQNPAVAFTITNDKWDFAMELTLARAPTEEIMLWASPPCNAGKRRNWDYRVLGLLQTPVEGANNFRRLYVKRFGVPPVGKRVFRSCSATDERLAGRAVGRQRGCPPEGGRIGEPKQPVGQGSESTSISGIQAKYERNTSRTQATRTPAPGHARAMPAPTLP